MRSRFSKILLLAATASPLLCARAAVEVERAQTEEVTEGTSNQADNKHEASVVGGGSIIKNLMSTARFGEADKAHQYANATAFAKIAQATLEESKDLRQTRAAFLKGMGAISDARAEFLPNVNATVGYTLAGRNTKKAEDDIQTGKSNSPKNKDFTREHGAKAGLEASMNLFRGFGSVAAARAAYNQNRADYESYKAQEGDTLQRNMSEVLRVITYRILLKDSEANVKMHQELLRASVEKLKVGAVDRSEVAYAQAKYALSQAKMDAVRVELAGAISDFELHTGLSATCIPLAHPDLSALLPKTLAMAKAWAEKHNHKVLSGNYLALARKAAIHRAASAFSPSVDLRVNADLSDMNDLNRRKSDAIDPSRYIRTASGKSYTSNYGVSVSIGLPLDVNGTRRTAVGGARHEYVKTTIGGAQTLASTLSDVETFLEWIQYKTDILEAYKKQVRACEIALQGSLQELAVGAKVYIQTIKAQSDLHDAQRDMAKAREDLVLTQMKLLNAMGKLDGTTFGAPGVDFDPLGLYTPNAAVEKTCCKKQVCPKKVALIKPAVVISPATPKGRAAPAA